MPIIMTIPTRKILSTVLSSILATSRLPDSPPSTPPAIIYGSIDKSKRAKPVVDAVKIIDDNCEKKIINIEFKLASFGPIENKNVNIRSEERRVGKECRYLRELN